MPQALPRQLGDQTKVSASFENSPLGNAHIPSQYVDNDPNETSEWRESLEAVAKNSGNRRAKYLMLELLRRSVELGLEVPKIAITSLPYNQMNLPNNFTAL